MNDLTIIKNNLKYRGNEFAIEDLYTSNFYDYSDSIAEDYYNKYFGVNELFIGIVQPYLALELFIKENKIDYINLDKANFPYNVYSIEIAKKYNIQINKTFNFLFKYVDVFLTNLASFMYITYLLIKIPYKHSIIKDYSTFALLRTKAGIQKFANINISKEYEIIQENSSVYRLFSRYSRLSWAFNSYLSSFYRMNEICSFYKTKMGKGISLPIRVFYRKRFIHALVYEHLINSFFNKFNIETFYTANNLDRFSVIEEVAAKNIGIKTVCIPHGIEYGFRFPKGFSGNKFYTITKYTANYLNKMYQTKKFVFNEALISNIFSLSSNKDELNQNIVYFTEPRDVFVNQNILEELIPKLKKISKKLYLRLHPGDNKVNYTNYDVEYAPDYADSLTYNICVARKSTVLLEALYNKSIAIAIITNEKDNNIFNTFPSLNSDKIIKTYNVGQLFEKIQINIK